MNIETRKSGERTFIKLSEDLTVRYAAELKKVLEESLKSSNDVEIGFTDVEDADLSFLQLLCSAGQTARTEGKNLVVDGKIPDVVLNLFFSTGFNNHSSCSDHKCIWNNVNMGEIS